MNRGAGYGMEVPRKYCLYGPKAYLEEGKEGSSENNLP